MDIENELAPPKSNKPNSNFEDININFGKIEVINNAQSKLEKFLDFYESEIKEFSSLFDINKFLMNKDYNTAIFNKKITKIFNLEDFKLYFKLDPKPLKDKDNNDPDKKTKEEQSGNKQNENKNKKAQRDKKKIENNINYPNIKEEEKKIVNNNENSFSEEKNDSLKSSETITENSELGLISASKISMTNASKISMTNIKYLNTKDIEIFANNVIAELDSRDVVEIMDGHDYEKQAKKYFEIFLDFCSEKKLEIGNSPTQKIASIYKLYDDLLKDNKNIKKNENIKGNAIKYPAAEFDLLINDVDKKTLINIINTFKSNIICKSEVSNLKEGVKYQIIGEIANNLLNQAIDKKKQIQKYIDIILINDSLKKEQKDITQNIERAFNTLNLNFHNDKILMILTDGSYLELLKAYNINDKDINNNPYLKQRDKLNINSFKSIIYLLKKLKINFFIFFISSGLHDNIDYYLSKYKKANELKEKNKIEDKTKEINTKKNVEENTKKEQEEKIKIEIQKEAQKAEIKKEDINTKFNEEDKNEDTNNNNNKF